MAPKRKQLSNVIGFDDAPFAPHQNKVKVVGAVFAGLRFDGIIVGQIEKDGSDATRVLEKLISESKFSKHLQLVMLQGITFGGFNVIDAHLLHKRLGLPILIVSRHPPDLQAIREALLTHIAEGERRWAWIDKLGPMEPVGKVQIQRVGLSYEQAASTIERFTIHGYLPEPLRVAHLIASALGEGDGESRGRP